MSCLFRVCARYVMLCRGYFGSNLTLSLITFFPYLGWRDNITHHMHHSPRRATQGANNSKYSLSGTAILSFNSFLLSAMLSVVLNCEKNVMPLNSKIIMQARTIDSGNWLCTEHNPYLGWVQCCSKLPPFIETQSILPGASLLCISMKEKRLKQSITLFMQMAGRWWQGAPGLSCAGPATVMNDFLIAFCPLISARAWIFCPDGDDFYPYFKVNQLRIVNTQWYRNPSMLVTIFRGVLRLFTWQHAYNNK